MRKALKPPRDLQWGQPSHIAEVDAQARRAVTAPRPSPEQKRRDDEQVRMLAEAIKGAR